MCIMKHFDNINDTIKLFDNLLLCFAIASFLHGVFQIAGKCGWSPDNLIF